MASVTLKNFKLTNFHYAAFMLKKIRCGHFIINDGCNVIQKLPNLSSKRFLSNIAHKYENKDHNSSNEQNVERNLDFLFTKIDFEIKRTGRTNMNFVREVLDKVKLSGTVSSLHGLYMIRCCSKLYGEIPSVKVPVINNIWKILQDWSVPMTCEHYNALLRVHLQNGTDFTPMNILSEMESKNISPNIVTYQLFVERFSNEGNLTGVSTILEYIKEKGLSVTEAIFNSLIKCHAKMNDMEGAHSMLEVMRNSNLTPSAKTYTVLACMYAEAGNVGGVNKTLLNAQNSGVILSNENYLDLIIPLAVGGNKQFADKIMQHLMATEEYHQDYVTMIMKLIVNDLEDIASKFLSLLGPSKFVATSNLFIKQLIKAGKPDDIIISYANEFEKRSHDNYIYLYAANVAIDYNRTDCAMKLFNEMHKQGYPIRTHNFISIMEVCRENNNLEGAWRCLKLMYELGIPANFKMYFDSIHLGVNNNLKPDELVTKFQSSGHTASSFVPVLFQFYCDAVMLTEANYVAKKYPTEAGQNFKLKKFLASYENCKDPKTFLQILKYVLQYEPESVSEEMIKKNYGDFLAYVMRSNLKLTKDFFIMLIEQGFKLEAKDYFSIESAVKTKAPSLLLLLSKMKDSTEEFSSEKEPAENNVVNISELEDELSKLKGKGYPTGPTLFKLLVLHIREKNTTRLSEIIEELEGQNFTFNAVIYSQLINHFALSDDLDMTTKFYKALKNQYPDYKLDCMKIINYVFTLIKYGKYEDAVNVLNGDLKDAFPPSNTEAFQRNVRKLLRSVSELADVPLVQSLHKALKNSSCYEFISDDSTFFDALVKVHLARGDLQGAVEAYRDIAKTYHVFPCRNLLLRQCIYSDDSILLQRVVDITAIYSGESKALCELAGVFIEMGHIPEAKKIFQNLGGKANIQNVEHLCDNFLQMNREIQLKHLIKITQDLWHIDRDKLYYYLFKLYDNRNDCESALVAWNSFKNEKLKPGEKTVALLSDLLKRNNRSSPFEVSSEESSSEVDHSISDEIYEDNSNVASFLKCVDTNHMSEALQLLSKMKKGHVRSIPLEYMSNFIDILAQNRMLIDLSQMVQPMSYIIDSCKDVLKPLLEKYSNAGDVEVFHQLTNFIPDFVLKKVHFNFFFCRAYINSERYEDLLSELERRINTKNKLFSVQAFLELLQHKADSQDRMINLAQRYMDEMKFDVPLSVIWAHFFKTEDYTKAEEFYKRFPVAVEKVDLVINMCVRKEQNHKLGRRFVDFIIQHDLKQRQKDKAYSNLLDALVFKGMHKEAANLIGECERQQVSLLYLRRSTLISLRDALERENIAVTFSIPEGEDSESSSDSE